MPTILTSQLDYWLHCVQSYLSECHNKFRINRLDNLIAQHDAVQRFTSGERRGGFIYNGLIWRQSNKPNPWFEHLLPLEKELQPAMDDYLNDELTAQKDFHKIRQIMLLALRGCDTRQDVRDLFPDSLLPAFKTDISGLSRTKEAGFTMAHSPVQWSQWEKIADRIHFHCAMRLIYS